MAWKKGKMSKQEKMHMVSFKGETMMKLWLGWQHSI